jgi:3-oxoacyl-[acyl-carrier-protein] synthase-3
VAAVVVAAERPHGEAVLLREIVLGADGGSRHLLRAERTADGAVEVHMDGTALALRAIRAMAEAVRDLAQQHRLAVPELAAVVVHAGNGRMPALLARQLAVSPDRIWSETERTGNLGSASLPAAWAARQPCPAGPILWTAAGAGLTWGAAISE